MPSAAASHILVKTEKEALDLKAKIAGGTTFESLAKQHSLCPSGKGGGSLGSFKPGQMVREFDAVVFGAIPVGQVSDPVKTQFGYHLVRVDQRVQ